MGFPPSGLFPAPKWRTISRTVSLLGVSCGRLACLLVGAVVAFDSMKATIGRPPEHTPRCRTSTSRVFTKEQSVTRPQRFRLRRAAALLGFSRFRVFPHDRRGLQRPGGLLPRACSSCLLADGSIAPRSIDLRSAGAHSLESTLPSCGSSPRHPSQGFGETGALEYRFSSVDDPRCRNLLNRFELAAFTDRSALGAMCRRQLGTAIS